MFPVKNLAEIVTIKGINDIPALVVKWFSL